MFDVSSHAVMPIVFTNSILSSMSDKVGIITTVTPSDAAANI